MVVLAAAEADGGDGKQTELVVRRKEGADEIWADEIEGDMERLQYNSQLT